MKKLLVSFLLILISLNINAEIVRESITEIRQLKEVEIIEKFSNSKTIGRFDQEGGQSIVEEIYWPNGEYTVAFKDYDTVAYGTWKIKNNKMCYKAISKKGTEIYGYNGEFACYYLFEGQRLKTGISGVDYKYIYVTETPNGDPFIEIKYFTSMEEVMTDTVKAKAKKKRDDKTKELQRKAALNKIEKERKAEEKKKQDSIESEKMKRLIAQARKNSQYNPGFRDLKPGMPFEDYKKICPRSNVCYGLQDIKFDASPFYGKIKTVNVLTLDMGPITSDGVFIDLINEFTDPDADIFRKMKNNFDNKYVLDYEFSTRDRQLFNNNEKNKLLVVYSKGQVVLRINRKERKDSRRKDLWLYIEYRDVQQATEFLKTNAPVKATLNDF